MLTPTSEAEIADSIRAAGGPLWIQGGGTRAIASNGDMLSVAGLSGIELYEPGALTIVARAGTPVREITNVLAENGQHLPFEPNDMAGLLASDGVSTIGGVVATNASGPRRFLSGACRDSLIGVRFVDGRGTIIKNGGRVMKNVTGYDLVKLMAGSHGTLGILTEVAFKVLPAPAARAVCLIEGLSVDRAVAAMSEALQTPFEVSGAAHTTAGVDGEPVTMLRLEGFAGSVTYRAGELANCLSGYGAVAVETDPDRIADGWAWVRDVEPFHGKVGDVWRISVKPSDAPEVVEKLGAEQVLLDWGGGLIWALTTPGQDARAALKGVGGHATLVRAGRDTIDRLGRFQPEAGPIARIAAGLRQKFDPRGILNHGLMD